MRTCTYCPHYAPYLGWDDDLGEIELCACCYGSPYDPKECEENMSNKYEVVCANERQMLMMVASLLACEHAHEFTIRKEEMAVQASAEAHECIQQWTLRENPLIEEIKKLGANTRTMPLYITAENGDLTEGRGPMIATGIYLDPEEAVRKVKGRGVQGVGDGEVYYIGMIEGGTSLSRGLLGEANKYYGYMKRRDGRWVYDYTDRRNEPDPENPEYQQYLELKKRFDS